MHTHPSMSGKRVPEQFWGHGEVARASSGLSPAGGQGPSPCTWQGRPELERTRRAHRDLAVPPGPLFPLSLLHPARLEYLPHFSESQAMSSLRVKKS